MPKNQTRNLHADFNLFRENSFRNNIACTNIENNKNERKSFSNDSKTREYIFEQINNKVLL